MQIAKDTVVSLTYQLFGSEGQLVEKTDDPISYLHGGYRAMFGLVERALEGRAAGYRCSVHLEPGDAFGEYQADLVRVEPRNLFPASLRVGMRLEGDSTEAGEPRIYVVTEVEGERVVVDGNHPLAGQAVVFSCMVTGVRAASAEEIAHGHVHGPHGHHH